MIRRREKRQKGSVFLTLWFSEVQCATCVPPEIADHKWEQGITWSQRGGSGASPQGQVDSQGKEGCQ